MKRLIEELRLSIRRLINQERRLKRFGAKILTVLLIHSILLQGCSSLSPKGSYSFFSEVDVPELNIDPPIQYQPFLLSTRDDGSYYMTEEAIRAAAANQISCTSNYENYKDLVLVVEFMSEKIAAMKAAGLIIESQQPSLIDMFPAFLAGFLINIVN